MSDNSRTGISPLTNYLFAPPHIAESHNAAPDCGTRAEPVIIDGGVDENYNPLLPLKDYAPPQR